MSADLLEQLAQYGADHRARQAPVERQEILARVRELTDDPSDDLPNDGRTAIVSETSTPTSRRPHRFRVLTAVAAGLLATTLVAGLILSTVDTSPEDDRIQGDLPPAAEQPPLTEPAPSSSNDLFAPVSGETQQTIIGDITWTLVEGDGSTQPERVTAEIDGEFFGVDESRQAWRSPDGISWEPTEATAETFGDVVDLGDESFATLFSADGRSELARWDGSEFVPVPLPDSLAPAAEGLRARGPSLFRPIAFGDELIVPASTSLDVPWSELYETTRVFPEWDAVTETIRLIAPESRDSLPLAVLTAELSADGSGAVEFRDAETGEIVTVVEPVPGIDPDEFLIRMGDGGISHNELYIGGADGFEVVETPWPLTQAPRLAALDDRLLAVVEYIQFAEVGVGDQEWELWTSIDGRSWEQIELPEPPRPRMDEISIVGDGSLALLTIVSSDGNVQLPDTWSTLDGLTWSPVDLDGGFGGFEISDIGWIQFGFEEWTGVNVSPDGLTWQRIPIALGQPRGPGNGDGSVHGDTIFLTMNENGGDRTMWVGHVETGGS